MDLRMEDLDQEINFGGTAVEPAKPLLRAATLKNEYFMNSLVVDYLQVENVFIQRFHFLI